MAAVVGGGPQDEIPEADAVEQGRAVDFDDEAGLDTAYLPTSAAAPATETPAKPTSSTKPSSFRSPTTKKSTGSRRRRAGIIDA